MLSVDLVKFYIFIFTAESTEHTEVNRYVKKIFRSISLGLVSIHFSIANKLCLFYVPFFGLTHRKGISRMKKCLSVLLVVFSLMTAQTLSGNYGCGPLEPCAWSLMVKGGVAPSHFTHRGFDLFAPNPFGLPIISGFFRVPKLEDLAGLPWQVGGEIGWNASNHIQLFLEGYYQRAKGKNLRVFDAPDLGFIVDERLGDYKNAAIFLGTRYFPCRLWSCFLPFVGFKAGTVRLNTLPCDLIFGGVLVTGSPFDFQIGHWVPSVGGQIGFDYRLFCRWSLVFTAEAVVTQGFRSNPNIVFVNTDQTAGITNAVTGQTGKIVSYPVTLGLRYQF